MRIAICEDDLQVCAQLESILGKYTTINKSSYQLKTFNSGDHFWFEYQNDSRPFDLILLDIELPGKMNGLDVAKYIRSANDEVVIVIVTAFTKYALEGYEVQPFQYLVKPIEEQKLLNILIAIDNKLSVKWDNCLNLSIQSGFLRIPYDDIFYFENRGHNIYIHTIEKTYKIYRKLDDIMSLCDERFIVTHKSYAINADKIAATENRYTRVLLNNGTRVPISQNKKVDFIELLFEYDQRIGMGSSIFKHKNIPQLA